MDSKSNSPGDSSTHATHSSVCFGSYVVAEKAAHYSEGKPPLASLPQAALREMAKVMAYGAKKYTRPGTCTCKTVVAKMHDPACPARTIISGRDNWRYGTEWTEFVNSALRHIAAFLDNEDVDEESKQLHLAHAMTDIAFVLEYQVKGVGTDDRFKGEKR